MARILTYGSSVTYGLYGGPEGGWADRLKMTFVERDITRETPRGRVFNLAAGALTIAKIVEYLPSDIERYAARCRTIGAFMVGNIESALIGDDATEPVMQLDTFRKGLEAATTICMEHGIRPLFIGMSPMDDERSVHPTVRTNSELSRTYDHTIAAHAKDAGTPYIDLQAHLTIQGINQTEFLHTDGQHPNPAGHGIIHDIVLTQVDDMLAKKWK
jgi:lysophospholipase L1-like esterase